jgi:hypothetical protein
MELTGLAAAQPSLLATRRGKLILVLLCTVAFLDFVDTTIVNVALPSMRLGLHTAMPAALTAGFQRALLASSVFLVIAAVIATRTSHTRGEPDQDVLEQQPQPEIRTEVAA